MVCDCIVLPLMRLWPETSRAEGELTGLKSEGKVLARDVRAREDRNPIVDYVL